MPLRKLSAFGTFHRQILSPYSHCMVTGNHWLYHTAKSWFRRCLTYCNSSFSTPHIPSCTRHGTFFFALQRLSRSHFQYRACQLSCSCRTCRLRTVVYTSRQELHLLNGTSWHGHVTLDSTMVSSSLVSHYPAPHRSSSLSRLATGYQLN